MSIGCLPLLIQLLHGTDREQVLSEQRSSANVKWAVREARRRASQALHNIVHAHPDDRRGRREARVLRLLEQIRDYSDFLRDLDSSNVDFSHNGTNFLCFKTLFFIFNHFKNYSYFDLLLSTFISKFTIFEAYNI